MWKSIIAVVAGALTWDALYFATHFVMLLLFPGSYDEKGATDSVPLLASALTLFIIYAVATGWLTARLAPDRPLMHATILGFVQWPQGLLAQIAYWDVLPDWYHFIFLVLLVPGYMLGGKLYKSQQR